MDIKDINPGLIVEHKKGRQYMIIGVALHTGRDEPLVIYCPTDEPNEWWARPLDMFLEVGRFKMVKD